MTAMLLLLVAALQAQQQNVSIIITGSQTQDLFVPDRNNNRVLRYVRPFVNGQNAFSVLGQSSFNTAISGTSATALAGPTAYAVDLVSNVYVSDNGNCRVVQFRPPFATGEAASLVLGKPDLDTPCTGSASATNTGNTGGVATDLLGNVWVADSSNHRVLRFKKPLSNGTAADIVIGQADFTSSACNRGASNPAVNTLCSPVGLAFDALGNLWVADGANHRVLQFKPPFQNGMNASIELGHPAATAFTSAATNDGGLSASSFDGPSGIGFDLLGNRLWVADLLNSRALRFDGPFRNGMAASVVLGQSSFTQNFPNQNSTPSASTLNDPQGIVMNLTGLGGVFVGDTLNNRTLLYSSPQSSGMNASVVLGQPDFTHNLQNQGNLDPNAASQSSPFAAGPSILALGVLAGLAGIRQLRRRK